MPRRRASDSANALAPSLEPLTAQGDPRRSVAASGIVCSGCIEKVWAPSSEAERSADSGVAPPTWPTNAGGPADVTAAHTDAISASGTQSSAALASAQDAAISLRP